MSYLNGSLVNRALAQVAVMVMLFTQFGAPLAVARAQDEKARQNVETVAAEDVIPTNQVGAGAPKKSLQIKVRESQRLRRPNRKVSPKMLDLTRPPTEEELREAGSMGGPLSPTRSADVVKLAAAGATPVQIKRMLEMNWSFGKAIDQRIKKNFPVAARMLQQHIEDYPDSPWAAEAALRLAFDAQHNGRPDEAQQRYENILDNTSSNPADPSFEVHQKAKVGWADLDIMLGRWDDAKVKLADIFQTDDDWRNRTWADAWYQQIATYERNPLLAQACGTLAVAAVMASAGHDKKAAARIAAMTPPRVDGFSIAELTRVAARNGMHMRGFRASIDQISALPVPFIAHYGAKPGEVTEAWFRSASFLKTGSATVSKTDLARPVKSPRSISGNSAKENKGAYRTRSIGHYMVVQAVDSAAQTVRVFDPQEKTVATLSYAQFNREWSGAGLVLDNDATRNQTVYASLWLSPQEMNRIHGGCCCIPRPPGAGGPGEDPPDGPKTQPGPPNCPNGAPVVSISRLTLNMYITDTPLWYQTPIGPDVAITCSYNSRDGLTRNSVFGNKWMFNYGTYLVENTDHAITVFMPTGEQNLYYPNADGVTYTPTIGVYNTLTKISTNHYELTFPTGDKYIYDIPAGTSSQQPYLVEVRDRWGYSLNMTYDSQVQLTKITDAQGKETNLTYSSGHIAKATDPYGRQASFSYDVNGNLRSVVDMEGNPFSYTYDADVRVTDLLTVQGTWHYVHDSVQGGGGIIPTMSRQISVTDPLQKTEVYQWRDPAGPAGPPFAYVGRASGVTTSASTTVIGGRGKMDDDNAPDGTATHYTYDPASGKPSSVTTGISTSTPQGFTTRYTYNFMGRVTSITNPRGYTTQLDYDTNGIDLLDVINAQGVMVIAYTYDAFHQPTSVTLDPANPDPAKRYTSSASYKPWGAPADMTDARGELTTYTYDSPVDSNAFSGTKRLVSISRPNDAGTAVTLAAFGYDEKGRVQTVNDQYGISQSFAFTRKYTYNDLDKLTDIQYHDGTSSKTEYACCNLPGVLQDRAGRKDYADYDVKKRLSRTQNALGGTVQTDYDDNSNLSEITDERGNVTHLAYDLRDRLVRKTYMGGAWEGFAYDAQGNLSSYRDTRGVITNYLYDANGNLTKIDYATSTDTTVQYDSLDRPVQMTDATGTTLFTYDNLNHVSSVDGPAAADTVSYTYDELGRRATMKINGTDTQTYTYDALGRLDYFTTPQGLFNYSYMGNTSLVNQLVYPNGTKATYTYDSLERLQQVQNLTSLAVNISKYTYAYDVTTNRDVRTSLQKTISPAAMETVTYGYDATNQLISELSSTPTALNKTYGYDLAGNRTGTTDQGGSTVSGGTSSTYNRNGLNQISTISRLMNVGGTVGPAIVTSLAYESRGGISSISSTDPNETEYASYFYDEAGRVNRILWRARGTNASLRQSLFVYDGLNRRSRTTEQTWNGATSAWVTDTNGDTRTVYDGMAAVQERDYASNAVNIKYVVNGAIGGVLSRRVMSGGTLLKDRYFQLDGMGSVVQVTDGSQVVVAKYDYDAYGNTIATSGTESAEQPYRYNGKWEHGRSRLLDYGFRFYNPGLGRWINRDPIGIVGGLNLYEFVGNDPNSELDAYGLATVSLGADLSGMLGPFAASGEFKAGFGFSWRCGWTFGYAYGPSAGMGASTAGAGGLTGLFEVNNAEQYGDNLGWGGELGGSGAYGGKLGAAYTHGDSANGNQTYQGLKLAAGLGGGGEFHQTMGYMWGRQWGGQCDCGN